MAKAKEPTSPNSKTPKTASPAPKQATGGFSGSLRSNRSPEEVYKLIQETAYFKAKARGFEPGHEVQDWIEAEAEVRERIGPRA